ncbi:MAG: ATP-binding protein [Candidatus Omnitrophica bacterium]|nr:ATP-binding protein [Candidatus Omnitrophota bacterium]
MLHRNLYLGIWKDLARAKSMVFLSGPRQSGKTTLSKQIAGQFSNSIYFNWDLVTNKKKLIEHPTFFEDIQRKDTTPPLVIFDEIHKYRKWKNYLKGVYDQFSDRYRFLILGSGRLNVFQKGGDSLAGRYFHFNLWPLTLGELANQRLAFKEFAKNPLQFIKEDPKTEKIWQQLFRLSGYPEPYLSGDETIYRRWSINYRQQLVREDIRNMTELKNIDEIEVLFSLLPSRVGSPLSLASLSRALQISPTTAQKWIKTFESFYLAFLIKPWTKKISRAITKERKLYLFDYADIASEAARFENMVALELLRAVSNWNDLGLADFKLHYLRNKEKEEADFLISQANHPFLLIETKLSDEHLSKSLLKFQSALEVPTVQLVHRPGICKVISNDKQQILVSSASRWIPLLP